jgi:hypothetical protein
MIDYADMTEEQQRIVDAGAEIIGQFPEGTTKEDIAAWIKARFLSEP